MARCLNTGPHPCMSHVEVAHNKCIVVTGSEGKLKALPNVIGMNSGLPLAVDTVHDGGDGMPQEWLRSELHARGVDGGALQPAVVFEPMSTPWADFWKNTFWKDYESIVPDSGKHLDGIPGNCSLYTVASTFKMHPLMLSCWTCLLHDAVHWSQINIRLQKFVEHFRPRMHIPRALSISLSLSRVSGDTGVMSYHLAPHLAYPQGT